MALFVRLVAVFLFVASPLICGQDPLEKAREMQARVSLRTLRRLGGDERSISENTLQRLQETAQRLSVFF